MMLLPQKSTTTSNNKKTKKVEVGERMAEYNNRKREELKSKPKLTSSQYYGTGAIVAIGFTRSKEEDMTLVHEPKEGDVAPAHKFEME